MSAPTSSEHANAAYRACTAPRLSVLVPFYRDDPQRLLEALATSAPGGVEVVLFDDGCPDPELNAAVIKASETVDLPILLISSRLNRGRSGARNRLAVAARSPWLLFLDADMTVGPNFLTRWLTHTQTTGAGALFGGFAPCAPTAKTRVHAALEAASNAHACAERTEMGSVTVCSSNLAVRAEAFAETPFDEDFSGWGWEDVDWALTAAQRFELAHVDNPARHGGLESVDQLLQKFGQSGPNFARLLQRHPAYGQRPGARLAAQVKALRLAALARAAGGLAARLPLLPIRLRVLGVKLFRAGVAAEAL